MTLDEGTFVDLGANALAATKLRDAAFTALAGAEQIVRVGTPQGLAAHS